MLNLKPIKLYSCASGPNPWKVAIILEELSIPYENIWIDLFTEVKQKPYTDINPNGRVPAIRDPNTGVTLWESGAILEYLVETYDKDNKLSYSTVPEKWHTRQWLMLQISGQGPYFGQLAWFTHFHPEKLSSAKERYLREVERVISVLDGWLRRDGAKKYLVGDKCTYADLSFVTWALSVGTFIDQEKTIDVKGDYPAYDQWLISMLERENVKKALVMRDEITAAMKK